MGFNNEIMCRRCGNRYSGLRSRCPKCGAPRVNQPTRVPPTTASVTQNTAAYRRSASNIRWQFIFGAILLVAVILAVVVLVVTGGGKTNASTPPVGQSSLFGGGKDKPVGGNNDSQGNNKGGYFSGSYISADLPTPSPSPEPIPEAEATPAIQSMSIAFLNQSVKNHEMSLTNAGEIVVDLDLNIYPAQDNAEITWKSSNEKILTVDERGIVRVVGSNPNDTVHATIIAECCGVQDYVTIYVPPIQATYLTQNLYDPETYIADNMEWDLIIYASPSPKAR